MEITGLSEYKGDTWCVELDGGQRIYVNEAVVNDFLLSKGKHIDAELLDRLKDADTLRKAKKRALYLLGSREYCREELYKKLRASYTEEVARAAADYMQEYGYVNDEDYAPRLAEYLIRTKRLGLRRVRYEMLRRGLDECLVEDVLSEYDDDEIDEEITALLSRKYYSKIQDIDDRRRTIAAMARRGYDYRAVKRCIEAMLEEYEDDEDFYLDE